MHLHATYFISDLHLDPTREHVSRALATFLTDIAGCDALYILGDLFEAWVGDDDDAALARDTAQLLRNFRESGVQLAFMPGNRDFLLGAGFCTRMGAQLLPDPSLINLYGTPTLLLHGDSLCTDDTEYQRFRTLSRTPAWRQQVLAMNLGERRTLASRMRQMSHEAQSLKAEDIVDVNSGEVGRVMQAWGANQLIHGHTHRPARHTEARGPRWVLGAWDSSACVLRADAHSVDLVDI